MANGKKTKQNDDDRQKETVTANQVKTARLVEAECYMIEIADWKWMLDKISKIRIYHGVLNSLAFALIGGALSAFIAAIGYNDVNKEKAITYGISLLFSGVMALSVSFLQKGNDLMLIKGVVKDMKHLQKKMEGDVYYRNSSIDPSQPNGSSRTTSGPDDD